MKSTTKAITLASAILLSAASGAAFAHYEYNDRGCGNQMMGSYPMTPMVPMPQMQGMMPQMQGMMPQMQGMMPQMQAMMPQMQAMMQQNRALMERMVDEPDVNKRRELMQQNMQAMHGQMMGRHMNPGAGAEIAPEQMQQMMEMMNQRMDRMQQMMEQMQQNQAQ